MPVSGPLAAVFVFPVALVGLTSNADIEAVAEPDGAGGIEVGVYLVEPGMSNTSSTQSDTYPFERLVWCVSLLTFSTCNSSFK